MLLLDRLQFLFGVVVGVVGDRSQSIICKMHRLKCASESDSDGQTLRHDWRLCVQDVPPQASKRAQNEIR